MQVAVFQMMRNVTYIPEYVAFISIKYLFFYSKIKCPQCFFFLVVLLVLTREYLFRGDHQVRSQNQCQ